MCDGKLFIAFLLNSASKAKREWREAAPGAPRERTNYTVTATVCLDVSYSMGRHQRRPHHAPPRCWCGNALEAARQEPLAAAEASSRTVAPYALANA